jgi:hypothetical protein
VEAYDLQHINLMVPAHGAALNTTQPYAFMQLLHAVM